MNSHTYKAQDEEDISQNSEDAWPKVFSIYQHKDTVRCIRISDDQSSLFSCSADKSIQQIDISTQKILFQKQHAHDIAINKLFLVPEMQQIIATGDDLGILRTWDLRMSDPLVSTIKAHSEPVTGIVATSDITQTALHLATCSSDGSMTVHEVQKKRNQLVFQPDRNLDSELTAMTLSKTKKNKQRLLAGTMEGALISWDCSDYEKMYGCSVISKEGIECIADVSDDTMIVGFSNGDMKLVDKQKMPFKAGKSIGCHDAGMPVLDLCVANNLAVSCSADETVRIWRL